VWPEFAMAAGWQNEAKTKPIGTWRVTGDAGSANVLVLQVNARLAAAWVGRRMWVGKLQNEARWTRGVLAYGHHRPRSDLKLKKRPMKSPMPDGQQIKPN